MTSDTSTVRPLRRGTSSSMIDQWLLPFAPQLPLAALVVEVNRAFHDFEACDYDRRHPEVFAQLPPLWRELIREAVALRPQASWRILDFGCGTGFEAVQLINGLGAPRIGELACYDLSPAMLERCRRRVGRRFPRALFADSVAELEAHAPYNLLATNSVLHHLADIPTVLAALEPYLAPEAVWLAGHEPSARFYRNPQCASVYEQFRSDRRGKLRRRWREFASPRGWRSRLARLLGQRISPKQATARYAHERGWFGKQPPGWLIDRLVDLHVAHSVDEASRGRGLDFQELSEQFAGRWRLCWRKCYSYMGPVYEGYLPWRWQQTCRRMAQRYPDDGANFCALWLRTA